jgi:hypothetical protein
MQGHDLLAAATAPFGATASRVVRASIIMTMIITIEPWGASG